MFLTSTSSINEDSLLGLIDDSLLKTLTQQEYQSNARRILSMIWWPKFLETLLIQHII